MGIGEAGELLRRSTVHVRCTGGPGRGAGPPRQSTGSGVIWDSEGTIITNAHVLGKGSYSVELWDGRSFPAELKARDDHLDLARLTLPAKGLPAAKFRYQPVRAGELVVAVGNPLGFTGALTTGSAHAAGPFSGLGRRRWVQASIRLAPGNSGGPLADAEGQVVGINTMIVSGGIALAVPSPTVERFVRKGASPRMGVTVQPVRLNRPTRVGLLVLSVEQGSPGEQASLLIGDVLTGTSEAAFAEAADLADAIMEAESGRLKLRFLRGDHARDREVVVSLMDRFAREAA
jgi:serine protease Do